MPASGVERAAVRQRCPPDYPLAKGSNNTHTHTRALWPVQFCTSELPHFPQSLMSLARPRIVPPALPHANYCLGASALFAPSASVPHRHMRVPLAPRVPHLLDMLRLHACE
jgi:hypothetical protein